MSHRITAGDLRPLVIADRSRDVHKELSRVDRITDDTIRARADIMDIDLANDLRRHDADENDSDERDDDLKKREDSDDEDAKGKNVESVMKKANEAAKKKVARRPRPKLDVDRYPHFPTLLSSTSLSSART